MYKRTVDHLRADLDAAPFAAAWAEGHAMSIDEAIAYAVEEEL